MQVAGFAASLPVLPSNPNVGGTSRSWQRPIVATLSVLGETMSATRSSLFTALSLAPLLGCVGSTTRPLTSAVTVTVAAADSLQELAFSVDVDGGPAELRGRNMQAGATDARLNASTPAVVVLHPGTTAVLFSTDGSRKLVVTASAAASRLGATASKVRLVSTSRGLEVQTF